MREFLFFDDAPIYGGAERSVFRLARFIRESLPARSARVVCPAASELAERCHAAGITVTEATFPDLGLLAAPRIALASRRLRRVLVGADTNVVVVGVSLRTMVYAHAAALGLHQPPPIVHFLPEQDSARRLTAKLMLRRYGAVVALGGNVARAYRRHLPGVRIRVVNNFLLPEEYATAARSARLRGKHRIPVLGVLTRLFPGKGVVELVTELAEIPDAWSTLLVGGERQDERYARAVEKRIAAVGFDERVRLLGRVDDLSSFFEHIDALVVPSVGHEGQPNVIIEALAHQCPVIVREPIWSSEFEGLPILPFRDVITLRDALARLGAEDVDPNELADRFGVMKVIEGIENAADAGAR